MTKEEFKARWEKDDNGDGITWDDIAKCAVEWGITDRPKTMPILKVQRLVLAAAGVMTVEDRIAELKEQIQMSGIDGGILTSDLIEELQQLEGN